MKYSFFFGIVVIAILVFFIADLPNIVFGMITFSLGFMIQLIRNKIKLNGF